MSFFNNWGVSDTPPPGVEADTQVDEAAEAHVEAIDNAPDEEDAPIDPMAGDGVFIDVLEPVEG